MRDAQYEYDRTFRLKIVALCLDDQWMAKYGSFIIQPNYFEREDEETIVDCILRYRAKFHRSPRDPDDIVAMLEKDYTETVSQIFIGRTKWDLALAGDLAVQFAKEQAAKLAILDSVDDINKGDLQAPIERMKKALAVGDNVESPGLDPIKDIGTWLPESFGGKIGTMWVHVDQQLEGGLTIGEEMGVVLAPANRGKTMALVNIGYGAASIANGVNVVHFSHEMSERKICKRYAARMVFRFPHRDDDLKRYAEEVVVTARKLLRGRIRVIGGAKEMSTNDVENHLDRLLAEGFEFGLIVDDYLDLLRPIRHYSDKRFELKDLYTWFRNLMPRYNCVGWTASQSNRDSFSKEIITLADVAEDIQKVNISDVVSSICQTREEEQAERCRLFMAKVRDAESHAMITAKYYKRQQSIVTTGYAEQKVGRDA